MTEPDAATHNTAESGSQVGIQAEHVDGSTVWINATVYQVPPDASPRQKYEVGVRYLEDGVPARARELIGDAIAHDYVNGEVRFHWVLAMLSKRSYRDLTPGERDQLARIAETLGEDTDDEWERALEVICELLDCLRSRSDPGLVLKQLLALEPLQRDRIERHLDLVLTGGMKDSLWAKTYQRAIEDRDGKYRRDRVWAYFQPAPIPPRARQPAEESTTLGDRFEAAAWSGLFVIAAGYLGWTVLTLEQPLPIIAFIVAHGAGYFAARNGLEWRYRAERLKAKDRDYIDQEEVGRAPKGGFANSVDNSFTYYFSRYAPKGVEHAVWLAETAGIRKVLRDEIVQVYRESRISVGRVTWLIRYLVREVKNRWEKGGGWEYRQQYKTTRSTKILFSISLATLFLAAITVVVSTIPAHPLPALLATFAALKSGRDAATHWLHIISERRRFTEEQREHDRTLAERQEEFGRWKEKLNVTRPSESEMEYWLYCDKTILLGEALRHYLLAWRDVIAHTFLQVPARSYRRARVKDGQWRYSRYDLRLFLVTQDGVREICRELDFEQISFRGEDRTNFRFEAVSSVRVAKTGGYSYNLELTLTNGPTRSIRITEPETSQPDPDEDPEELSKINLDATGFAHTLHILEGIAAEGKSWIDRDPHTNGDADGSL